MKSFARNWTKSRSKTLNPLNTYDKFWTENYSVEISAINTVNFNEAAHKFDDMHSLPCPEIDSTLHRSLEHLVYLSTIRVGDSKSPFTMQDQAIFDDNLRIQYKVGLFFRLNAMVIAVTCLVTLINLTQLFSCGSSYYANFNTTESSYNCLNSTASSVISLILNLIFMLIVGLVSLYATGILPNEASVIANKAQDRVRALHDGMKGWDEGMR